jgi:hypothetical protein
MRAWVCRATGGIYLWDSDTGEPLEDEEFDDEDDASPEDGEPSGHTGPAVEAGVDETGADDPYKLPAEKEATEKALREWCEVNEVEIEEPARKPDAPDRSCP